MFRRHDVVAFLRNLGFRYGKKETSRTQLYRKSGSVLRVWIPKAELLEEPTVRSLLRQAGCNTEATDRFSTDHRIVPS